MKQVKKYISLILIIISIASIFLIGIIIKISNNVAPEDSEASSIDTVECNLKPGKFRMITTKNYVDENGDYSLFFEELIEDKINNTYERVPYNGKVDFMIKVYNEITKQWDVTFYNDFLNSENTISKTTKCENGYCTIKVTDKVISEMYALRDGETSDPLSEECYLKNSALSKVQVNVGSTFNLKKLDNYWPQGENAIGEEWRFVGHNFPKNTGFETEIGFKDENAFNLKADWIESDNVWYSVKSDMTGYHTPNMPWQGYGSSCYNLIDIQSPYNHCNTNQCNTEYCNIPNPPVDKRRTIGNATWYLNSNTVLPDNKMNSGEKYLVANGGYAYYWGACSNTFNENTQPFISGTESLNCLKTDWDNEEYYLSKGFYQSNWNGNEENPMYTAKDINKEELRNYIIAPEYIGDGWGVYAITNHGNRIWAVYSYLSIDNQNRNILTLSFREGPTNFIGHCENSECNSISGHREDWVFEDPQEQGLKGRQVNLYSRSCGPRALSEDLLNVNNTETDFINAPMNKKREYCNQDPDMIFNQDFESPHIELISTN